MGLSPRSVDPATLEEILIVPFGLGEERAVCTWPQAWLREGQQWLRCPSASNQYWRRYTGIDLSAEYDPSVVSEELAGRICKAFGLFGTPEQCVAPLP